MSMTETIKLYDRDAYATEFEADIISCEPNKADDKQFDIILNQTLFSRRRADRARTWEYLEALGSLMCRLRMESLLIRWIFPQVIAARQKRKLVSKSPAMNLSRRKWSLQQASTYRQIDWQHRFTICSNTVESTFFGNCPPQVWF